MAHIQGLNSEQQYAVTTEANVVQVLAPPGSGKTKTLTSRVAHLLQDRKYQPWNVICLTFTIKSSREMGERLCRLIGEDTGKKVILGTFHSVCRRYLASYGHLIGLPKGFGITDASDTIAIIKRIVKRLNLNFDPRRAQNKISNCKSKGIGPDQLAKEANARSSKKPANAPNTIDKQEFITVFEEYEAHLERSNLLDFDDLLLRCVELLQKFPTCVRNVQAVLIDEFQDTNHVQFDLMRLFAQHCQCVTTVGDPDQSIYGWRNAEVANLGKMKELWPDASVVNLEQNYRSAGAILAAAQTLIEQDTVRPPKALVPTHREGTRPVLRLLPNPEIEGEWIVSEIKRSITLGAGLLTHSDIAVLLRSSPLSRQIEGAFGRAGIPYRMVGGMKFFDRVEIKVLLDYLRVVAQPTNSDALSRILNTPSRGIGDTTIKGLLEEATNQGATLWDVIRKSVQGIRKPAVRITTKQSAGLSSLYNLIRRAREKLEDKEHYASPPDLIEFVLKKLDFKDYLAKEYKEDHETRWENIEQLLVQANDPSFSPDSEELKDDALPSVDGIEQETQSKAMESLSKFLANVAIASEVQSKEEREADGKPRNTVTISTMHAAKGLEWPVVFIPACYEGSIPHSRAEDTDEERRLLYVAMTRAQALLHMSIPVQDFSGDKRDCSSFLSKGEVRSRLVESAPLLEFSLMEDIALILGREAPSRSDMSKAMSRCDNILDDRWPLNGEFDPEETAKQWAGMSNSYGYRTAQEGFKRRKVSGETGEVTSTMYTKTTMQRGQSFTMPAAATGFTTASKQMALQQSVEEQEVRVKSSISIKAAVTPKSQPEEKVARSRSTKRPAGQSSLLGWFGGNKTAERSREGLESPREAAMTRGISVERIPAREDHNEYAPDRDGPPLPQLAAGPRQPMRSVAMNRSNRPVPPSQPFAPCRRPLSNTDKPTFEGRGKSHVLLSSSPPRDLGDQAGTMDTKVPATDDQPKNAKGLTTFRSATTTHSTTMGRLNGGGHIARKRLGMGGPMRPWRP